MLVLDTSRIEVSVTHDHVLDIKSTFKQEDKANAEEWMQEVALDISNAYGGKQAGLYQMIKGGL